MKKADNQSDEKIAVNNSHNSEKKSKKGGPGRPFKKGVSGNPKGRPPGSVSLLGQLARENAFKAWEVISQAIDSGDVDAAKFTITYANPKPRTQNVDPAWQSDEAQEILQAYFDGKMFVEEAALRLELQGITVPEIMKIMAQKQDPEPVDNTGGQFFAITEEDVKERMAERERQLEAQRQGIPDRRREVASLRDQVADTFACSDKNRKDGKNGNGE